MGSIKRFSTYAVALAALLLPAAAFGAICAADAVPAATLLLPYFEVGLSPESSGSFSCEGPDTVFRVNNAGTVPALASVVLWTDWAVPTGKFHLLLEPGAGQTISLCDVIASGQLPEPGDTGPFSGCGGADFTLTGEALDRIRNAHGGFPIGSVDGCLGEALNEGEDSTSSDWIARGYITIDNLNDCSALVPGQDGYFADSDSDSDSHSDSDSGSDTRSTTGVANNINQLWGDWFLIDPATTSSTARSLSLVHIEAHPSLSEKHLPVLDPTAPPDPLSGGLNLDSRTRLGRMSNATGYTFYGRYTYVGTTRQRRGGFDHREPLTTIWSTRFVNPPGAPTPVDSGTTLLVWRDSRSGLDDTGFPCGRCTDGAGPDWCPLAEAAVVCTSDTGESVELCGSTAPAGGCFPLATNSVRFGEAGFDPPFATGTCTLNLNQRAQRPDRRGSVRRSIAQSWLVVLDGEDSASPRRAAQRGAGAPTSLSSACQLYNP